MWNDLEKDYARELQDLGYGVVFRVSCFGFRVQGLLLRWYVGGLGYLRGSNLPTLLGGMQVVQGI